MIIIDNLYIILSEYDNSFDIVIERGMFNALFNNSINSIEYYAQTNDFSTYVDHYLYIEDRGVLGVHNDICAMNFLLWLIVNKHLGTE